MQNLDLIQKALHRADPKAVPLVALNTLQKMQIQGLEIWIKLLNIILAITVPNNDNIAMYPIEE